MNEMKSSLKMSKITSLKKKVRFVIGKKHKNKVSTCLSLIIHISFIMTLYKNELSHLYLSKVINK